MGKQRDFLGLLIFSRFVNFFLSLLIFSGFLGLLIFFLCLVS